MPKWLVPPERWQDPNNPVVSPLARPDRDKEYMATVKAKATYSRTDVDTMGIKVLKFLFHADGAQTTEQIRQALGMGSRHCNMVMKPLRSSGLLHTSTQARKGRGPRPFRHTLRDATRKMMMGDW